MILIARMSTNFCAGWYPRKSALTNTFTENQEGYQACGEGVPVHGRDAHFKLHNPVGIILLLLDLSTLFLQY